MTNEEKALEIKRNDPCCVWNNGCPNVYYAAMEMAEWKDGNLWHNAQGDVLPEIDREVIVLCINGKVCFGHRPDPKGFNCKNIDTGEIEHLEPMTYDKGGWNIPDVRWWMDCNLPNMEEQQ